MRMILLVLVCMVVGCDEPRPRPFSRRVSDPINRFDPKYSVFTGEVVEEPTMVHIDYPPDALSKHQRSKQVYAAHVLVHNYKMTVYSLLDFKPEVGKKYSVRNSTKFICEVKGD